MKKQLLATGITIASCLISFEAKAATFSGLNVFGDSLVDTGNLFNLTDALVSPLGFSGLPPSPPYDQRNSNGPIWIDNLSQDLGLSPTLSTDLFLNPPIFPPTEGINFAVSGALSSDVHILDDDLPPFLGDLFLGFQEQIDAFTLLSTVLPPDPNDLYVVWVGGNDYNEAFFNPASLNRASLTELPNTVTDNIIDGLTQLSSLGAKELLVVNLPSLGEAPFADSLDAVFPQDISQILNQISSAHNNLLSAKLNAFEQQQPDTNVLTLDINGLFDDILADPASFGLTNVTEPCLANFQPGFQFDGVCDNPDEYLWWDDTHPTAAAYEIISDFALATLNHQGEYVTIDDDMAYTTVSEPNSARVLLITSTVLIGMGLITNKSTAQKFKSEI